MTSTSLDFTHDPATRSWVDSANDGSTDFPLQNLPLAIFRRRGSAEAWRGGVAIGDQVLDLAALAASHHDLVARAASNHDLATMVASRTEAVDAGPTATAMEPARKALQACAGPALNDYLALGRPAWRALRHALFALLRAEVPPTVREALTPMLVPQADVEHALPAQVGDYTDFYTSIHHALNVGRLIFPDNPLTPNFQWLPIAYHGRASSLRVGQPGFGFHRPHGQAMPPGATAPVYTPCTRLDFELEMGFFIGPGNELGSPIALKDAEDHIAGMCLLNDWSARDHQFWEMAPLGPFLGKNFCTTVSPWLVSLEALAPFRCAFTRPPQDPQPLPYLDDEGNRARGSIDVQLEVRLDTPAHHAAGAAPSAIARTSFRHQYWTVAQMVAQHTVGGCDLRSGDLLGTGTVSGPTPAEAGAIVELSRGGREPITLAATGERRTFLEDGDTVILRGWCDREGAVRIGFGECRGTVWPVRSAG
jgi:fumarylacetoacetase